MFISYLMDFHHSMKFNFRENNKYNEKIKLKLLHCYLINYIMFVAILSILMLHFNTIVVKDQNLVKLKF